MAGNIISGNGRNGITLNGLETTGTIVFGNFIGIDALGVAARGNGRQGIAIFDSPSNFIGAGERNVISGNAQSGITISGATARFNFVSDNVIGADQGVSQPVPNGSAGVIVTSGASDNFIGTVAGAGPNLIAFNTQSGVRVLTGVNNAIRGNSIFQNGQLGIDIGGAGVTANDAGDTDSGANNLQNSPVLSAVTGGVQATINSTPNMPMQIELFASPACDGSGSGEGMTLVGTVVVLTDALGNATIPFLPTPDGQFITATATDGANNTSEFSACAQGSPAIAISLPNTLPIGVGRSVTATVALSEPAPAGGIVVTVTSDAPSTASISAPGTVSIPEGGSAGQVTVNGVNVGNTTLRASAPGYMQGTVAVSVTQNLISTPATLNVAFGQSTALPVNIGPSPAPPGGLTLDVVSISPSIVEVLTPQITVPEGALSANATVRGAGFGNATVTVSNPLYSPSSTTVNSSGVLNIVQASASFNNGLPGPLLTVQLESNGTPVAALADLVVTLTSADTLCVTVPASVTIPAGLVSTTFRPAYGGTATLPCNAAVTATSSALTPDSVTITVNQQATISVQSALTVGAGLQLSTFAILGASGHGGVDVTVQSNDPTRVLVSRDATTAGTASTTVNVPNGQTFVTYYVHALENATGSATVTISAPGFTGGSHPVDVVPIGIEIAGLDPDTTTLSPDDIDWYVQVGVPCAGNTHLCTVQNLRPGAPPFVVSLALAPAQTAIAQLRSDQPVATGQTVTKPIQPGIYYTQAVLGGTSYGLTFDPLAGGQTTVTATGPVGVLTMTTTGVRPVTISGPTISVQSALTVGAGLQLSTFAILGASEHGGVDVTVQSSDPTRVLVSRDAVTCRDRIDHRQRAERSNLRDLLRPCARERDGLGERDRLRPGLHRRLACRPGRPDRYRNRQPGPRYDDALRGRHRLVRPGRSALRGQHALCARSRTVAPVAPPFVVSLALAPAPTAIAQLRSDQPVATGQTVTKPIQPGIYYTQAVLAGTSYGLTFDPLAGGQTTVTATGPAGVLTMTTTGVRPVTISGPTISVQNALTVGAGLQLSTFAILGASGHGGVDVTVQSNNPARVLVSRDAVTAGTASTTVNVPNGQTFVTYYVHALENVTGSANVTISAPGFTGGSHAVDVVPIGIEIRQPGPCPDQSLARRQRLVCAGWNPVRGQRAVVHGPEPPPRRAFVHRHLYQHRAAMSRVWPRISRLPSVRS